MLMGVAPTIGVWKIWGSHNEPPPWYYNDFINCNIYFDMQAIACNIFVTLMRLVKMHRSILSSMCTCVSTTIKNLEIRCDLCN